MAHDRVADSIEAQTGRASMKIVGILAGGVLIGASYLAELLFGGNSPQGAALAMVGALVLAAPVCMQAIRHLLAGQMHMDELVALTILAALSISDFQMAGLVAFLLLLSNLVESRSALGARASIEGLIRLAPKRAHKLVDGTEQLVDPATLTPGDIIRVRPGDDIPADGTILTGQTSINESNITGESLPADKAAGDEVFAGTANLTGAVDVTVTRAGRDTTLGKVQSLILHAESTKIPIMRLMERYAGWYTPVVLMLAGIVWFFTKEVDRSITMLIVACPVALILAVPTAMVAALSCAARLGILVKDVRTLEIARTLTAVVFDKTGTLTTGQLTLTRLKPIGDVDAADLLTLAASVEQMSRHPVAQAVVAKAGEARLALAQPTEAIEVPGKGVAGVIDGATVRIGRRLWLAEQGVDVSALEREEYAEPEGLSTLYVARDTRLLGWIGLEDRTRPRARQAMDHLRELGIRHLVMVTGDRWSVARRVAAEMGCSEVQAEVLPQDKLDLVDALRRDGHRVAVIGDGVNDAPALAAGDLSVAMGAAGSDVAINSASVALMNDDLPRLPFMIRLSRSAIGVVHQNMMFGIVFITISLILSGLGAITPVLGAVLQLTAALAVVFNSARLVRFGEELHRQSPHQAPTRAVRVESVAAGA
ncbi:MAG: cation-translocating P-type ATPase [Planctomycetes bacterium]|nr:cation-translocating P-type ATPase [Planctomycetota bacterium]